MCTNITDPTDNNKEFVCITHTASSLLNVISYIVGTKCYYYQLNRTEYILIIKSIKPVDVLTIQVLN